MESTTITTLLPKKEVVQAAKGDSVAVVLELMAKHNILSVPVRDEQ